jgi:hypothetical protein
MSPLSFAVRGKGVDHTTVSLLPKMNNQRMTLIDNASMVGYFPGDTRGAVCNAFQLR